MRQVDSLGPRFGRRGKRCPKKGQPPSLARRDRELVGAGLAWATIVGPAWSAAAAAEAQALADSNGAFADASQAWTRAIGSAFVGWALAQAQADADFGIAGAIAGATAGNAAAAAGSAFSAAASKAAGDLTRALNAVQTGFVDAATAASLKATKTIAAAETVERKAVAKADVVLAKDLQAAWGTYASAECGAVILNAREIATIGADYKKDVAGAELAAVKAVAPARKTSSVAAAEANGVYHVKVTGIVADLGILSGKIRVESTKAKATSLSDWLGKKAHGLWTTANDVVRTISKSYDAISMAAHTTLSGLGVIPGFGIFPDAADLALTLAELPFGKSDGKDLALATVSLVTTATPGPVDGLAAGAKIGTRMAKAAAKVADGAGAAGKGYGDALGAGRNLLSQARVPRVRNATWGAVVEHGETAMEHIRKGHFHDSRPGQASSRFSEANSLAGKIKALVQDAVAKGHHSINSRGQTSIRHSFEEVIGTDVNGRKTKVLQVFIDHLGNVVTAFPVR